MTDEATPDVIALALAVPHPDTDTLPDIPADYPLTEQAIAHLARGILALEASAERREKAMEAEVQAWRAYVEAPRLRAKAYRALIRDRLIAVNMQKITGPFITVSLTKPREKILVLDEAAAIEVCEKLRADRAWEAKKRLVKKEFDDVYRARPSEFMLCARTDPGEPGLSIRGKE